MNAERWYEPQECPKCGADETDDRFQDRFANHRCEYYEMWLDQ
jgi:hypothetical protein